jgi:murein DD-endopeptidase MepM/ murein hydrolase activator NlpD
MTETIVERDQGTLRELLAVRQRLARRKLSLEEAERDQAAAAAEVRVQRNLVARRTAVAKARAKAADEDRAEIERQLAAMEEVSREVEAMLARVQRAGVTAGAYDGTWTGSLGQPTVGRLTSPFGWRMHPILHVRKHHDGIDLANSYGTPIRAAEKGRVIHAGWWGAIGESVIIDHGSGISTVYGHFTRGSLRVSTGDIVSRGQVIGAMGSTGRSTGSHLHFGVRRYGTPVNPLGF